MTQARMIFLIDFEDVAACSTAAFPPQRYCFELDQASGLDFQHVSAVTIGPPLFRDTPGPRYRLSILVLQQHFDGLASACKLRAKRRRRRTSS